MARKTTKAAQPEAAAESASVRKQAEAQPAKPGKKPAKKVKFLVGIIGASDVRRYTEAVNDNCVAVHFSGIAFGTAKSNYLSYLGLDEIEKRTMFSLIPEYCEKKVLHDINKNLKLYLMGKGIAFTMPMSGVSSIIGDAVLSTPTKEEEQGTHREERRRMSDRNKIHDLIIAVVNQKFTDKALDSARAAGATGATVMHTRSVDNERAEQIIGTSLKQETDTIMLLASSEYKLKIMEAIRDTAGLKTDGGAVLFSLPVDSITGIGRFADVADDDD